MTTEMQMITCDFCGKRGPYAQNYNGKLRCQPCYRNLLRSSAGLPPYKAPRRRKRKVSTRANSNKARNLAPPAWVDEVVEEVRQLTGYHSKRLLILWRKGSGKFSSGHTKVQAGEIVITAGSDLFDQGDTLLHELAHWLCRPNTHHKQQFWLTYWKLVRHFGLNEGKCLERSKAYRTRAELAYDKINATQEVQQ